jgi:hypothetical protein
VGALVSRAIVRDDPPRVFVAEDIDTINWVRACQLVDAVLAFIARTGTAVAVYSSTEFHGAADAAVGPLELQLTPLFTD